jgi:serine/threonine protein kinase
MPDRRCPQCKLETAELADARDRCPRCGGLLLPDAAAETRSVSDDFVAAVPNVASAMGKEDLAFTPGEIIARRYRIVSLLGRGGMGEVYRADDLRLGHPVALKFVSAAVSRNELRLQRFVREVRLARQISHPNICRVYDIAEVSGRHFLSMEYIDGEDLSSLLRRVGRLPFDKALDVTHQICAALTAAHEKGVLHLDLKPANIMIDGRGRALITDFSIAVSRPDEIAPGAGTPAYMAPEQVMGRELTVQTDLYALGLVMYEAFTGRRAITAQNIDERRRLVMTAEPVPPLPFRFARIRSRDPRIGLINPHADDPRPFSMVCGPFIFRYCPARCVGAVRTARNDYVRCPWGRFAPRSTTNQTVVVHGESAIRSTAAPHFY